MAVKRIHQLDDQLTLDTSAYFALDRTAYGEARRFPASALDSRYLLESNNLSDLTDAGAARTNLGLVAGGAGDIWVEKAGDTMTGSLIISRGAAPNFLDLTRTSVPVTWRFEIGGAGNLGFSDQTSVTFPFFMDAATPNFTLNLKSTGRIGIGISGPLALLHIDQLSTTAAIPVLYLDQADISEEMIEFNTTIGVGNAIEAVGAKVLTTTHFIKVTITGVGARYFPVGTIA